MADENELWISKITLPSGNTYNLKDRKARELIAALEGGSYFLGISSTPITEGSTTATITVGGEEKEASNGNIAIYGKKEFIFDGSKWSEFGDLTAIQLTVEKDNVLGEGTTITASPSSVSFSGSTTDVALGEATTFALTNGSVSHGTPSKDNVLGEATTFTASAPTITLGGTTKYLSASAANANTAWNSKDQQVVVKEYDAYTTDTFVKSVTAETGKKLVTTSIIPTNGTETVSSVTRTASKLVTTTVPNVTGNTTVSIPNVSGNTTVVANKSTWTFTMGSGDNDETLIIGGGNGADVTATNTTLGSNLTATNTTLGTAVTVATGAVAANGGGSDIVTDVSISNKTVAKAGTAVTVATGQTDANGSGAEIVTGVTVGQSSSAITSLGTPKTANVIGASSTFTITQPSITLTGNASSATGRITYLEAAAPTATAPSITVGTNDKVAAVIGMPTSTVNTGITVGTNDKVTAVTNVGTGTAAAQNITVTPEVVSAVTEATLTGNS